MNDVENKIYKKTDTQFPIYILIWFQDKVN